MVTDNESTKLSSSGHTHTVKTNNNNTEKIRRETKNETNFQRRKGSILSPQVEEDNDLKEKRRLVELSAKPLLFEYFLVSIHSLINVYFNSKLN